jgi:hypothetical protein
MPIGEIVVKLVVVARAAAASCVTEPRNLLLVPHSTSKACMQASEKRGRLHLDLAGLLFALTCSRHLSIYVRQHQ